MKTCISLISLCLIVLLAGAGLCATESYSYDIPMAATGWTQDIVLPQFNTALGTLNSITLSLNGSILGSFRFENTGSSSGTPTLTTSSLLTIKRLDGTTLLEANPVASITETVGPYDGITNFEGTSGRTYNNQPASDSVVLNLLPSSSDFSLFTGTGNLTLPVSTSGSSWVTGGGNLAVLFLCDTGASGTVIYDYTPVPEPSGIIAMLAGLTGLAGVVARRRK